MSEVVQVWQIALGVSEDTVASYLSCLSEDEVARADRFRFADDRRRFIVARGTLRHVLALSFGRLPEEIDFSYGEYGKPELLGEQVTFNLSHSGELAVCVLGDRQPVGIDIERVRPMESLESMVSRCLCGAEKERVLMAGQPEQSRLFLQHWTCKEAYLKAIGRGLSQSMQSVEIELSPPRLSKVPEGAVERWQLYPMRLPAEYVGALVVAGEVRVDHRRWQHPSR